MHRNIRVEQVSETIRKNADMVYRLAFSMVKDKYDAEDVQQEVFLRFIRKVPRFESEEHEKAWFIRVTVNLCKNLWKTAWRQKVVSMEQMKLEDIHNGDVAEVNNMGKTSKGDFVETRCVSEISMGDGLTEEEEKLIETVKKLPVKYRAVIHLFYYEEMSVEEMAATLRLKPSNVRTRLTRARKMLKEWLKEDV